MSVSKDDHAIGEAENSQDMNSSKCFKLLRLMTDLFNLIQIHSASRITFAAAQVVSYGGRLFSSKQGIACSRPSNSNTHSMRNNGQGFDKIEEQNIRLLPVNVQRLIERYTKYTAVYSSLRRITHGPWVIRRHLTVFLQSQNNVANPPGLEINTSYRLAGSKACSIDPLLGLLY